MSEQGATHARHHAYSQQRLGAGTPEDLIDPFATVTAYEALPAAIQQCYGGLVDTVLLQISADEDEDRLPQCVRGIQAIPNLFEDYNLTAH